jgi:membrane protein YqaA with SNARE-associated domain
MHFIRTNWEWFVERAEGTHAKAWLAALSFTESSVFIIPPDFLLVAIVLAGGKWLYYAILTTITSIAGAGFGYLLGAFFFNMIAAPLVAFYGWGPELDRAQEIFNDGAFWVMLTAAFTPIPFKVFVLAAGFLHVNPLTFFVGSIIGRAARYFVLAWAADRFGMRAITLARRYTVPATIVGALIVIVYVILHTLM